ncbi:MAG: hypothetical protein P4L77_12045 [Sulfuriferula sp.]|nr:hypothetical protein [Sulfuriferula sp.]
MATINVTITDVTKGPFNVAALFREWHPGDNSAALRQTDSMQ